jgi:CheY-like chemotaxis protein
MGQRTVHVVEDDPAQRELREMVLEAKGFTVVGREDAPDAVLMDLRIPTVDDGLALVRKLRGCEPAPKIVVLSGAVGAIQGTEEERMVDAILEKPCPSGLLVRTLERLLPLFWLCLAVWPLAAQTVDCKRHAPILFEREDTIGKNNDVPLMHYCEWDAAERSITYTVIFSNEDGGTSTRALMARWGRTTDIEYVYKVWLNSDGSAARRQIQTRDHADVPFEGPFEGDRPLLVPVTKNNMLAGAATASMRRGKRFDLEPVLLDLREHAREYAMDLRPEIARIAAEELRREGKLREYGTVRGEDISDPANYAVIELKATQEGGGRIALGVQVRGADVMQMSHLGDVRATIERSGWMRTAIELRPGTKVADVQRLAFTCYGKGSCTVERVKFVDLRGERRAVKMEGPVRVEAGKVWLVELE